MGRSALLPPGGLSGASGCKMCCGGSQVLDWDPYLQVHCSKLHALVRAAGLVFMFVCFSKVYSRLILFELLTWCALERCVLCPRFLSSPSVLQSHHLCCGSGVWWVECWLWACLCFPMLMFPHGISHCLFKAYHGPQSGSED